MNTYVRHRRVDRNRHLYNQCAPVQPSGLIPLRLTSVGTSRACLVSNGNRYLVFVDDGNGWVQGACRGTTNKVLAYKWHGQLVESLRRGR